MTTTQKGILTLMRCAITGCAAPLPEDFSLEDAEAFGAKHQITQLLYYGAVKCGISKSKPVMQRMFQQYLRLMLRSERQLAQINKLFQAFDENGIDYLPLKGVNMKALYPHPELRFMGDADILIRVSQYDKIRSIMKSFSFEEKGENEYELPWIHPELYVEFHKQIIAPQDKDFCRYFSDGWPLAEPLQNSRYCLSSEDEFLFLFAHFVKHYRKAGIGCHHVLDLWVYLRANSQLDTAYLKQGLEQMHLWEFYQNMRRVIANWFEDGPSDDITEFITQYIFSGGRWGSMDNLLLSLFTTDKISGKSTNKFSILLRKAFPPLSRMAPVFPTLKKAPYLLPFFWIFRILRGLFVRKTYLRRTSQVLNLANKQDISNHHRSLQYVGLDFHFSEE